MQNHCHLEDVSKGRLPTSCTLLAALIQLGKPKNTVQRGSKVSLFPKIGSDLNLPEHDGVEVTVHKL